MSDRKTKAGARIFCDGDCGTCDNSTAAAQKDEIMISDRISKAVERLIREHDYVKVVRCGVCKHADLCKATLEYKGKMGFCSKGKRADT